MERLERFYRIQSMLQNGRVVSSADFVKALEISMATFNRDLAYLRDRMDMPIEYSAMDGGYILNAPAGKTWTLPGLWFNSEETFALLTIKSLLSDLEPGLLGSNVQSLLARISKLFEDQTGGAAVVEDRIVLRKTFARSQRHPYFAVVAKALLSKRRLSILHLNRNTGQTTQREVSPQRLVHHRDNWYLDAWCHMRDDLRSFGLDAIERADLVDQKAKALSVKEVVKRMDSTYGIFSSGPVNWAVLSFSPARAQWVGREVWHPRQETWTGEDGRHFMRLPYGNPTELIMDILRHLPDVQIEEPDDLREQVRGIVTQWLKAGSGRG